MKPKVKIKGAGKIIKRFHELGEDGVKKAKEIMEKSAKTVQKKAKTHVPVDTGLLKSSIATKVYRDEGGTVGVVGPSKEAVSGDPYYGYFVEYGTQKMSAQPFMRPAADQSAAEVTQFFEDGMREFISRVGV